MDYAEIKRLLMSVSDPAERLELVIDLGASIPPIPENHPCTEISGCASRVDIASDGRGNYYGAADSALVRGILAIILAMVRGKTKGQIKKMDLWGEFNGLNLGLGAGRMTGVHAIVNYLSNHN